MDAPVKLNPLEPAETFLDGVYIGLYSRKVGAEYKTVARKYTDMAASGESKRLRDVYNGAPPEWRDKLGDEEPDLGVDKHPEMTQDELSEELDEFEFELVAFLGANKMLVDKEGNQLEQISTPEKVDELGPVVAKRYLTAFEDGLESLGKL